MLGSSSTWSNNVSGNPQLGILGLQAAFELGETTVDHQNDPIPVSIDTLVVNVAEEWTAIQLTQNADEPFTADETLMQVAESVSFPTRFRITRISLVKIGLRGILLYTTRISSSKSLLNSQIGMRIALAPLSLLLVSGFVFTIMIPVVGSDLTQPKGRKKS